MTLKICEEQAKQLLEQHLVAAKDVLENEVNSIKLVRALEAKIITISLEENSLTELPIMVSLLRNYVNKTYRSISESAIQYVTSALIYFLSNDDLILDSVPELGFIDDVAVIQYCLRKVEKEMVLYKRWKEQ